MINRYAFEIPYIYIHIYIITPSCRKRVHWLNKEKISRKDVIHVYARSIIPLISVHCFRFVPLVLPILSQRQEPSVVYIELSRNYSIYFCYHKIEARVINRVNREYFLEDATTSCLHMHINTISFVYEFIKCTKSTIYIW